MPDVRMSTSGFVGRERELRALESLLDQASSSGGRAAMLVGEPGIGKTRLARELAAVARAGGASVLWGTCAERETPPFGPCVEAASEHVAARPAELHAHLGPSLPLPPGWVIRSLVGTLDCGSIVMIAVADTPSAIEV